MPGEIRLARKVGCNAGAPAMDLALFNRQVDLNPTWIAPDVVELGA